MEGLFKEVGIKVVVGVLSGFVLGLLWNSIGFFGWVKKTLESVKDKVEGMETVVNNISTGMTDAVTRLKQPDNWGLGTKETNKLLEQLIQEIRELNTSIVRLLTIVEQRGWFSKGG